MEKLRGEVDRARIALEKSGAEQWEIMASKSKSVTVGVREGEVDKHQASESLGLAIRLVKDHRPGFSYIYGAENERDIISAVEQALASSRAADPEPALTFPETAPPEILLETYDPEVARDNVANMIRRAERLASAALSADKRVVHVHPAEVSSLVSRVFLCNSHGLELCDAATRVSAGAAAVASYDGEQEMGWESRSACFLEDIDERAIGIEAGQKAAAYLGAKPVQDGLYNVVFTRDVAAEFLDILADGLMGDNVAKGRSLLAGKIGHKLVSPLVTIVDDGLMPRGLGSAPFDDEGTAQSRTVLFEQGILRGYVYDRLWAGRTGTLSTGNAVRPSLKGPPGVGFTNLHIAPGGGDQNSLVEQMSNGLIISYILGAHTADPVTGEFSLGASGHLVQKGRIVRPVKSIAIAGQILDLFNKVEAVGADLRMFGRSGSPTVLVKDVSVSGP